MIAEEKLTYDDLLIVPEYSNIDSRAEISLLRGVGAVDLGIPIISAAMTTVTEAEMLIAMRNLGGLGIHHRYFSAQSIHPTLQDYLYDNLLCGVQAVSPSMLKDDKIKSALEGAVRAYRRNHQLRPTLPVVSVDVAHGDREEVYSFVEWLKHIDVAIWSGNIVTVEAAKRWAAVLDPCIDAITVGVGLGSACSTRIVSGCGYPQASAIYEIKKEFPEFDIIADGGIRSSGDIVKALALGASAVILGNLLAGTDEAPGEIEYRYDEHGNKDAYKAYEGMASESALTKAGKAINVEGVSGLVPYTGPVAKVVNELVSGIKTGMGYVGARTITELQEKAQFVRVTQNGVIEGQARI